MPDRPPIHFLLVDDDTVDVMTARRAFQKAKVGSPMVTAGDGIEALASLRSGALPAAKRVVLLDLNMPRMNGIEFLRELRADPELRATPVVVLTTSAGERDVTDALALNVAGYFVKPTSFVDFVSLVASIHEYWSHVELR
jgi:CheY-like chemotaxis protein